MSIRGDTVIYEHFISRMRCLKGEGQQQNHLRERDMHIMNKTSYFTAALKINSTKSLSIPAGTSFSPSIF